MASDWQFFTGIYQHIDSIAFLVLRPHFLSIAYLPCKLGSGERPLTIMRAARRHAYMARLPKDVRGYGLLCSLPPSPHALASADVCSVSRTSAQGVLAWEYPALEVGAPNVIEECPPLQPCSRLLQRASRRADRHSSAHMAELLRDGTLHVEHRISTPNLQRTGRSGHWKLQPPTQAARRLERKSRVSRVLGCSVFPKRHIRRPHVIRDGRRTGMGAPSGAYHAWLGLSRPRIRTNGGCGAAAQPAGSQRRRCDKGHGRAGWHRQEVPAHVSALLEQQHAAVGRRVLWAALHLFPLVCPDALAGGLDGGTLFAGHFAGQGLPVSFPAAWERPYDVAPSPWAGQHDQILGEPCCAASRRCFCSSPGRLLRFRRPGTLLFLVASMCSSTAGDAADANDGDTIHSSGPSLEVDVSAPPAPSPKCCAT